MPSDHSAAALAWAAFYLRHRCALTTYAFSLTGRTADAEDLLHDVLTRLVRETPEPQHARAYAFRAMRNLAIDGRRARGTEPLNKAVRLDAQAAESHFANPASARTDGLAFLDTQAAELAARETAQRVQAALRQIAVPQREVIVLKTYCDLTFEEIAAVLNEPLATVASRYRRGLAELRPLLESEARHGR